jgi:hypothetical protein
MSGLHIEDGIYKVFSNRMVESLVVTRRCQIIFSNPSVGISLLVEQWFSSEAVHSLGLKIAPETRTNFRSAEC